MSHRDHAGREVHAVDPAPPVAQIARNPPGAATGVQHVALLLPQQRREVIDHREVHRLFGLSSWKQRGVLHGHRVVRQADLIGQRVAIHGDSLPAPQAAPAPKKVHQPRIHRSPNTSICTSSALECTYE